MIGTRGYKLHHIFLQDLSWKNPSLNVNIIVEILVIDNGEHIRHFKATKVKADIWKSRQIYISYTKAHMELGKALELVNGNYEESYKKVQYLCP